MKIEPGTLVRLHVKMYDAQGNLLEESDAPLVYLHGAQDIFPRIEAALDGQEEGFATSLLLQPEDAFGDDDPALLHLVPVAQLGEGARLGLRYDRLPGAAPDGRMYTLIDLADGMAVLDGNHPLAGRALRFDLRVLGVERADADELAAASVPDFLRPLAAHEVHGGEGRAH
ncbi:MAG: peptidylprolyl isomerase [Betaproteobacteria bacterium]|jgi:FKBP-type peptidyl-prolyl cis-trans isomerase SlyD